MKNVKKKLLSLLLVVVLLVCTVPFQAMADGGKAVKVWFMTEDEVDLGAHEITTATSVTMEGLMDFCPSGYQFVAAYNANNAGYPLSMEEIIPNKSIVVNDNLFFLIIVKEKAAAENPGEDSGSGEGTGTEENPGTGVEIITPPSGSDDAPAADSYKVYVDYTDGAEGEPASIFTMTEGQKYGDRLPANPQRSGMKFLRWVYKGTNTQVTGNDTLDASKADDDNKIFIEAKWDLKKLFLTLDENRQGEEYINYGVSVSTGEKIFNKVNQYKPTRKGYVFMGWFLNGMKIVEDTIYDLPDSATAYAKWAKESDVPGVPNPKEKDGKIYLEIYLNGDYTLAKRVDITSYAADGVITRAEAEKVVKKYYSAKAGYKLGYDGLFDEAGWYDYTHDPETKGDASIDVDLWTDHYVYVMVKNVKVSAADPSNPKTGDAGILMPLIAMFSSAAAAAFVYGKKRR